jgi:hypothetical protein
MVYLTILENGDGPKFGAATISNNWGDIRKMGNGMDCHKQVTRRSVVQTGSWLGTIESGNPSPP